MIPQKLTIAGFLSYREPVEIDFSTFDLACISGANGAGKSSLLDAITWALFGRARKQDDSLIHNHPDVKAAEVSLVFEYEGGLYRVQRTSPRAKTTNLEFQVAQPEDHSWKPLTERTLRETQDRIVKTLRMDYDTFVNASFFLQGKADSFTQQKPGERKRILANILGLDIWEEYRIRSAKRRMDLENEIASLDGRLAEISADLHMETDLLARLSALQTEIEAAIQATRTKESELQHMRTIVSLLDEKRKQVADLHNDSDSAGRHLEGRQTYLRGRQEELQTHQQTLERAADIQAAYQAWQQAWQELQRWDQVAQDFLEHEKRRQAPLMEIAAEKARLEQERDALLKLESEVTVLQEQMAQLAAERDKSVETVSQVKSILDRQEDVEEKIARARQSQAEARAENPRLKSEMDELKERIETLSKTQDAPCPVCGKPLPGAERQKLIEELTGQGTQLGDRWRNNRDLLATVDAQVSELEAELLHVRQAGNDLLTLQRTADQAEARLAQAGQDVDAWQTTGRPRLQEITTCLENEDFAQEQRAILAKIDAELKAIGYDAGAHDAIRKEEAAGRSAQEERINLERAQTAQEGLQKEIAELVKDISIQERELARRQAACDEAAALLAAQEAEAPNIHQTEQEYYTHKEQENMKREEVVGVKQRVENLAIQRVRRAELETQRSGLARQIGQYKQLEKAFGKSGIPALLIEQALPMIEERANRVLGDLTDDVMSVRFLTQREYKDEKRADLRETLDIQITDDAGTRDYELYSGGEAFRVNFAVRLALAEVLAQRAGARLQTLIIDEGFGSQDALGRQRLVEAINRVRDDFAKILVITHIEEIKELFPVRIEVDKGLNGSTIKIT
jgi:exonuclease SbcC